MRYALFVLIFLFLLGKVYSQSVPSPVACYNFSWNLNEANGGTPMTIITSAGTYSAGQTLCGLDSMYSWDPGEGLNLVIGSTFPKNHYTIEMLFKLVPPYLAQWQRIIAFKNDTSDNGLYTYQNNLQMYTQNVGTSNLAQPNTWFRLFLTRDSLTDSMKGYINGNLEINFKDNLHAGIFDSDLILFKDDLIVPGEEAGGTIDFVRIYDEPLTAIQISQIIVDATAPTITISGNTSICQGQSTTLTASGASGYLWGTGQTTNSITITPLTNVTYSLASWNYSFCTKTCETHTSIFISVNPVPIVTINSSGPTTICQGDSVTLTSNYSSGNIWNTGATTNSINVNTSGAYSVIVSSGNCADTAYKTVTVNPIPIANAGNDTTVCYGSSVTLTASGSQSNTYAWSNGDNTVSTIVSPTTVTSYTVSAIDGPCSDTDTVTVNIDPLPEVEVSEDVSIVPGASTQLVATGIGFYSWNPVTNLSCIDCPTPVATPETTTEYCVYLTNSSNCTDSACVTVYVEADLVFYIPNSFSPNGDGINEEFFGKGENIDTFEMYIFDRWGHSLFYSDDINKHWDGRIKKDGDTLPSAVYVYTINIKDKEGNFHKYTGKVALVK